MEKLRFFLDGKKFTLITDHKPLEEIKKKAEFGSPRLMRWIERIQRFVFDVKYREGHKLIGADALSRSVMTVKDGEDEEEKLEKKVFEYHKRMCHRKTTLVHLKKELKIEISKEKLKKILNKCIVCKRKEGKPGKSCKFIHTTFPGEKVGIDLMEVTRNQRIVVAIDYFTRKIYAKYIINKKPEHIVRFLDYVSSEIKINTIVSDNGCEFNNKKVNEWCKSRGIYLNLSIPYYHQSNGRVERAIRTVRNGLRKIKGNIKNVLSKVVKAYNNTIHRGIMMSPNEAFRQENWNKILDFQKKYIQEFERKERKFEKLNVGDIVLLRNEHNKTKMSDVFSKRGVVIQRCGSDSYKVRTLNGNEYLRHALQLKLFKEGEVGNNK
jgi:hypothetical protein